MRVTVSKSKNATILYLTKSVRINGKSTTKTVERLGSLEEVQARAGDMDAMEWAKMYAAKRTSEEKLGIAKLLLNIRTTSLSTRESVVPAMLAIFFCKIFIILLGLTRYVILFHKNINSIMT